MSYVGEEGSRGVGDGSTWSLSLPLTLNPLLYTDHNVKRGLEVPVFKGPPGTRKSGVGLSSPW